MRLLGLEQGGGWGREGRLSHFFNENKVEAIVTLQWWDYDSMLGKSSRRRLILKESLISMKMSLRERK